MSSQNKALSMLNSVLVIVALILIAHLVPLSTANTVAHNQITNNEQEDHHDLDPKHWPTKKDVIPHISPKAPNPAVIPLAPEGHHDNTSTDTNNKSANNYRDFLSIVNFLNGVARDSVITVIAIAMMIYIVVGTIVSNRHTRVLPRQYVPVNRRNNSNTNSNGHIEQPPQVIIAQANGNVNNANNIDSNPHPNISGNVQETTL